MKNLLFLLILTGFCGCTIAEKEIFSEKKRLKISYDNPRFVSASNQTIIFSINKMFFNSNPDSATNKCETPIRTDNILVKTDLQGNIISEKTLESNTPIGYKFKADESGFWGMSGGGWVSISRKSDLSYRIFKADYDGKILTEQSFDFKKNLEKSESIYFDTYVVDKENAAFVFGSVRETNKSSSTNRGLFIAKIKGGKVEVFNNYGKVDFIHTNVFAISININPDKSLTAIWVKSIDDRSAKTLFIERFNEKLELTQSFQFPTLMSQFKSIQLTDNQIVVYENGYLSASTKMYFIEPNGNKATEKVINFDVEPPSFSGVQEIGGKLYLWGRNNAQTNMIFEITKDFKTIKTSIKSENSFGANQFLTNENGIITINGLLLTAGNTISKTKSFVELNKSSTVTNSYKKRLYEFLPYFRCSN